MMHIVVNTVLLSMCIMHVELQTNGKLHANIDDKHFHAELCYLYDL